MLARMTRQAVTSADLLGRIEMLNVVCSKCERQGRYRVQTIIREVGLDGALTDWFARISADCPRRKSGQFSDWCGIHSPDLVRLACPGGPDDEHGRQ
jgi:hypothetical protein